MASQRLPKLPQLLDRKIYKTGQTRGADDDEIFQNRVSRTSTVLIPFPVWRMHFTPEEWAAHFAKGYIVLISPNDYSVLGVLDRTQHRPVRAYASGFCEYADLLHVLNSRLAGTHPDLLWPSSFTPL